MNEEIISLTKLVCSSGENSCYKHAFSTHPGKCFIKTNLTTPSLTVKVRDTPPESGGEMSIILLELNNLHLKKFSSLLRRSTPDGTVRGEVVTYDTAQLSCLRQERGELKCRFNTSES